MPYTGIPLSQWQYLLTIVNTGIFTKKNKNFTKRDLNLKKKLKRFRQAFSILIWGGYDSHLPNTHGIYHCNENKHVSKNINGWGGGWYCRVMLSSNRRWQFLHELKSNNWQFGELRKEKRMLEGNNDSETFFNCSCMFVKKHL